MVGLLLKWYAREARDLPWRRTTDPYAILVSEVMLQQTQVARVIPRYEAWLERWPTAAALADAPVADVLSRGCGLGYNRRALRLREACAVVAAQGWPEDLRSCPASGPTPRRHGRVRVRARHGGAGHERRRLLARFGRALEPREGEGPLFNQATIELGATGVPGARAAL